MADVGVDVGRGAEGDVDELEVGAGSGGEELPLELEEFEGLGTIPRMVVVPSKVTVPSEPSP